jgi:hypothetical protein
MAKLIALTLTVSLCAITLAGCSSRTMLVENVPPPNFSGPTITPQPGNPLPNLPPPSPVTRPQPPVAATSVPPAWIPQAGASRSWKWIVIHHSATSSGSARMFDRMHREKGWDELGYHFVIGNGTSTGDGQIEVGPRWPRQKWGAHAKTADNRFNEHGIGICLVGNFDLERPTPQQQKALARLIAHLMKTYQITPDRIIGHGDTGKPTECPGRNMNIAAIRRMATQMASASESAHDPQPAAFAGHDPLDPSISPSELLIDPTPGFPPPVYSSNP